MFYGASMIKHHNLSNLNGGVIHPSLSSMYAIAVKFVFFLLSQTDLKLNTQATHLRVQNCQHPVPRKATR